MCHNPWSNRDVFEFVSGCTVYEPIHILFNVLILFHGSVVFLYGVQQLIIQKRKDIPLCATCVGFFFMLNYLVLLCTGLTYADRNYGINFLHACAISFLYLNVNLHNFRNLEVVRAVDSYTAAKSHHWQLHSKKLNLGLFAITCLLQYLKMLLPIGTDVDFINLAGSLTIILSTISCIPRLMYAYELKRILIHAKQQNTTHQNEKKSTTTTTTTRQTEDIYTPLIAQLDKVLKSSFYGVLFAVLLNTLWITIPALRHNSYIVYNIQMMSAPSIGLISLRTTRGHQTNNQNNNSGEIDKKTHTTSKGSSRDRGTSHQHSPSIGSPRSIALENTPLGPSASIESLGSEHVPLVAVDSTRGGHPDLSSSTHQNIQSIDQSNPKIDIAIPVSSTGEKSETLPIFNPFNSSKQQSQETLEKELEKV